jgi:hypothetical protein
VIPRRATAARPASNNTISSHLRDAGSTLVSERVRWTGVRSSEGWAACATQEAYPRASLGDAYIVINIVVRVTEEGKCKGRETAHPRKQREDWDTREKTKPSAPSKNREGAATRKFKPASKAAPPAMRVPPLARGEGCRTLEVCFLEQIRRRHQSAFLFGQPSG